MRRRSRGARHLHLVHGGGDAAASLDTARAISRATDLAPAQGAGKVVQWAKRRGARTVVTHKRWWWAPALT